MDKNKFDEKLKSMAKNEETNIPDSLRKKVDEAYSQIHENKSSMSNNYLILKIASLLIVALLGINVVMPTVAENIPLIGEVFKSLNENIGVSTEYSKYGVDVNKEIKLDNDEILKIKSVAYDGIEVAIFYEVSSNKPLIADNYYISLGFEGRNIGGYGGSCWGSKENEKLFYGVASYHIDFGGETLKSPQKLNLNVTINSVYSDSGDDKSLNKDNGFNVKLDSRKYPSTEKKINKIIKTDMSETEIHDVYLTGLNLAVTSTTKVMDDSGKSIGFYMFDNQIGPLTDDGGLGDTDKDIQKNIHYSKVTEKNIGTVKFIPYLIDYNGMEKDKENDEVHLKEEITVNEGGILDYDKYGDITFEPLTFDGEKAYLKIKTTGLMMYQYIILNSVDENREEEYHYGIKREEEYKDGVYSYILEFDNMDINKKYIYSAYDNFKHIEILNDYIFEVNFTE